MADHPNQDIVYALGDLVEWLLLAGKTTGKKQPIVPYLTAFKAEFDFPDLIGSGVGAFCTVEMLHRARRMIGDQFKRIRGYVVHAERYTNLSHVGTHDVLLRADTLDPARNHAFTPQSHDEQDLLALLAACRPWQTTVLQVYQIPALVPAAPAPVSLADPAPHAERHVVLHRLDIPPGQHTPPPMPADEPLPEPTRVMPTFTPAPALTSMTAVLQAVGTSIEQQITTWQTLQAETWRLLIDDYRQLPVMPHAPTPDEAHAIDKERRDRLAKSSKEVRDAIALWIEREHVAGWREHVAVRAAERREKNAELDPKDQLSEKLLLAEDLSLLERPMRCWRNIAEAKFAEQILIGLQDTMHRSVAAHSVVLPFTPSAPLVPSVREEEKYDDSWLRDEGGRP